MQTPTDNERKLIEALKAIVLETMDYTPKRRTDADSYLPRCMVNQAQQALAAYGQDIAPDPQMMDSAPASPHNFVSSQPLQPPGVVGPVQSAVGGNASVVVQVYALGAGIAIKRDSADLPGGQGAFELEANGKVLVFDPRRAPKTDWLVCPIESYEATVGLQVETVDQKNLSELGGAIGHGESSCKTVIVCLPQGYGKTTIRAALARRLGCSYIVDGWHASHEVIEGALHLTNDSFQLCGTISRESAA